MPIDHIIDIIQPIPGIQRDGTPFNSKSCIDGQWCRWYLGLPNKIGGYTLIDPGTTEIIRNLFEVNKQNSVDIYLGRPSSLAVTNTTLGGICGAENDRTPDDFEADPNNMWTFDLYTNPSVSTTIVLGNNPITSSMGTLLVTVTVSDTSIFVNGQQITLSGATETGGLTPEQLNISAPITIISDTQFTYTVSGESAGSTQTSGGNAVNLTYNTQVTYVIAHAAPNASDINNNVQTNIYWGDINANSPLILIDPVYLPISSGGIVCYPPYIFMYGNNGIVSYTDNPNNWSTALNNPTDGTKVIKGILSRGNNPTILFFTLNSLISATFQGGDPPFNFTTIDPDISLLAQNCIATGYNIVFWVGTDDFYTYTGVVRPLVNDMNKNYFFENLNYNYRNKIFSYLNKRYNEWWIHWPKGTATENTDVLIYNWKEERFYDSILGRSAGYYSKSLRSPILADANTILNKFNPTTPVTLSIPNNGLATSNASSTVTVTLGRLTNLQNGNVVTISGAEDVGGIDAENLNVSSSIIITSFPNTPTIFTYTAGSNATSTVEAGGGDAIFYSQILPNECYGVWQHETNPKNMVLYGQSLAIQSYFETNIKTIFDQNPSEDRNLRARRIEPDFVQNEEMQLIINYRSFAQGIIYSSEPYIFFPAPQQEPLAKVDTTQMGRLVSFRFESNIVNGDYQAGKILLNYAPGDVRP